MTANKKIFHVVMGPIILVITTMGLSNLLGTPGAQATGTLLWMIYWWVTCPVHITVTGLVPIAVNAILNIVPMSMLTSQYASDSIILIFGSGLLCLPWAMIGLDKRLALKVLSIVGPSMKSQITVWLFASILLSMAMPNVAVCALLTPIAVSMLAAAGQTDVKKSIAAVPILLAIGWGAGIGGAGTPLGGAMNLAAISYIEQFTGEEFMYINWIVRLLPYFICATLLLWVGMLCMPLKVKRLEGTHEYFASEYAKLGKITKEEIICAVLFILASIGAFTRPLYASLLPGLSPAYIFLILGSLSFFISTKSKGVLLTWERAEKGTMWGMMVLFGGGLALGQLINGSGASAKIAEHMCSLSLDGGLLTIIVFVVIGRIISELTNSTTSAAIIIPIVLTTTQTLGLNPIPYWFITVMGFNAEFILPISVRAIPVAYGLDPNKMFKGGIVMSTLNLILVIIMGYLMLQYWPTFSSPLY